VLAPSATADGQGYARRILLATRALAVPVVAWALVILAVVPGLASRPAGERTIVIPVFVFGTAVLAGVGLSDLARRPGSLRARCVVAVGLLWSLSALAASADPTLYSIGRVLAWSLELGVAYLLLSYPSGRLTARREQQLLGAAVAVLVLLYLSTVLVVPYFPRSSFWSACGAHCPRNVFALGRAAAGLVSGILIPLRQVLTVGLFVAVAATVNARGQRSGMLRESYIPIVITAILWAAGITVIFVLRDVTARGPSQLADGVNTLILPVAVLAWAAGRLKRRLVAAQSIQRLASAGDTGEDETLADLKRDAGSGAPRPVTVHPLRACGRSPRIVDRLRRRPCRGVRSTRPLRDRDRPGRLASHARSRPGARARRAPSRRGIRRGGPGTHSFDGRARL
jgi:hypothetical protein